MGQLIAGSADNNMHGRLPIRNAGAVDDGARALEAVVMAPQRQVDLGFDQQGLEVCA